MPFPSLAEAESAGEESLGAFIRYYLPNLQTHQKWKTENLDSAQPPREAWPIGKVVEAYPGVDGKVRSAKISI